MAAPINERQFFGFRRTAGDSSRVNDNSRGVPALLVPTTDRDMHFASAADQGTDWNVSNPTHPTFYVHSETTPATDYVSVSHDGTTVTFNHAGGTTYAFQVDAVTEFNITASSINPNANDGSALGTATVSWADLFLATGGVINFNNGNVTVTHAAGTLTSNVGLWSSGATAPFGYTTGAGGTVTQMTNKTTGVSLSTVTGAITMNGASLAGDTTAAFVLTNTAIAATDAVLVLHESVGTLGAYSFGSTGAAGSATISVHNNTAGALSEAIVLRFVVIKSVNA